MKKKLQKNDKNILKNIEKLENVPLSNFSTIKIGGIAKLIVFPKSIAEIKKILAYNKKYFIIGNGSNILFDDDGYEGTILSLKNFNKIFIHDQYVWVGAGTNLFMLNNFLADHNLSGLEWSYGIPASIGGLVYMNGGSFGYEICQFVEEVVVLKNNKIKKLRKKDIKFSYRSANFTDEIILFVKLKLFFGINVRQKMEEFFAKKKFLQPYDMPSLGSVFKVVLTDPVIYPAKLIDSLGLKGVTIGGAQISCKHAGFIVNIGNATSLDVQNLIILIEKEFQKLGVKAEKEIIILKNEGL